MSVDLLVTSAVVILGIAVLVAIPLTMMASAIPYASFSAPSNRHEFISRKVVVLGLVAVFAGGCLMGIGAWLARGDSRYGALSALVMTSMALFGTGLLTVGLSPVPSWLLEVLGPIAERWPASVRLAVRDLAQRRARAAVAIMLVTVTTAFGLALTIIAVGQTAQSSAEYQPSGRLGSLLVRPASTIGLPFSAADAVAVRAAMERELPGVPIAQSESVPLPWSFSADALGVEMSEEAFSWRQVIGDEKVLRYLTGDQSTPYDENTAVVITSAGVRVDSVHLSYERDEKDRTMVSKAVRAVAARTSDPHMEGVFVPSKIVRELGFQLEPRDLIVDPTLHRTTAEEQRRLDDRLDDAVARVYVERGFEASTWWRSVATLAFLAAVGCAPAAGFGRVANSRQARVMRRIGKGTNAAFRLFCAFRAGVSALCGTVLGAVLGCAAGIALLWPLTVRGGWEDPARVSFETPWTVVVAVVAGIPVLAAVLGAVLARERPHIPAPPAGRPWVHEVG
ncbi:hypothetical protein [Nonomuraea fuscirosea]|uniref:hypothetical protein n=1 Tax=Nonomuraea fuscirosea TaxID=1291556 RepID=UPI0033CD2044